MEEATPADRRHQGHQDTTLDKTPGTAKRAVSYIRVSTKQQAVRDGNPEGYSLPTQRSYALRKAEEKVAVLPTRSKATSA